MTIYFSSGAFRGRNVTEVIRQASEENIYLIELSSGLKCSSQEHDFLINQAKSKRFNFLVHNYFPAPNKPFVLNIAALDSESLLPSMAMARNGIRLAQQLDSPFYSIHAGFAAKINPHELGKPEEQAKSLNAQKINYDASYESMIINTRALADFAGVHDRNLLIENNVLSPKFLEKCNNNPLLLTSPQEILQFFSDLDRSNVGLLLDVAHAAVTSNAIGFDLYEMVTKVASVTQCLHLSENDMIVDSNDIITNQFWFFELIHLFKGIPFVLETYNITSPQFVKQQSLLSEHINP